MAPAADPGTDLRSEDDPLVSVLMACFNYEQYVGEALASALDQTWGKLEVIVCDDGSTDGSRDAVRKVRRSDGRVRLLTQANGGMARALNHAFEHSRGEIVCLLDADDLFRPGKVEAVVEAARRQRAAGLIVHRVTPVDENGRVLGPDQPRDLQGGRLEAAALANGGYLPMPPCSGSSFTRDTARELFPIPPRFRRVADGYLLACAPHVTEVAAIPFPLAGYRIHGSNMTGTTHVNAAVVARVIEDFTMIFDGLKSFVRTRCGEAAFRKLDLDDSLPYLEQIVAHGILGGRPLHLPGTLSPREALGRMPRGERKVLLSVLTLLPRDLGARMLEVWWGSSRLKRPWHAARGWFTSKRERRRPPDPGHFRHDSARE